MNFLNFDVVVLGAGPGGCSTAGHLAQKGFKVALLEEKEFPRFKIGESLLPYSLEVFRNLNFEDKLKSHFLQKNGAEFVDFQSGEKIKFDFSNTGKSKYPYAFEVKRAELDQLFLDHVREEFGVQVFNPIKISKSLEKESEVEVTFEDQNQSEHIVRSPFLVDASGRQSKFAPHVTSKSPLNSFNDLACFSHFKNLPRKEGRDEGDITIGILGQGAWLWQIPFKDKTSSMGLVCSKKVYKSLDEGDDLFDYFKNKFPAFKTYMEGAEQLGPLKFASNYSYKREQYYGKRWLLVGDAMGFLDPVFSTGVHVALYSGMKAADSIVQALEGGVTLNQDLGESYQKNMQKGFKRFSGLLSIFYDPTFISHMKKTLQRERVRQSFTELVAGGAWEDDNDLFRMGVV